MIRAIRWSKALCLIATLLLACSRCPAQVASAELSGTVLDASGAVVPNAKVTANQTATNTARATVSGKSGEYVISALAPGAYTVTVDAPGFRKLVHSGVSLQINQQATLNLTLEIGEASETVEVTGTPPLLQAQSSSLGTVVNEKLVNQLPLNGRNFVQLATLSPGVNGVGFSASGTIMGGARPDDRRPASNIFSNGNREGDNNFLYDGIDNNERLTLSIVLRPAVEAVQEFKIQTNLYSADVGRNSGAVVDVITKSGTNVLHGSLFEIMRNSAVDARSYFNKRGSAFPSFRLNQFGGSLGGPVMLPKLYDGRNRTFFFMDYEGFRSSTQAFVLGNVPTVRERTGDFTETAPIYDPLTTRANPGGTGLIRDQFAGNQIPVGRRDPIAMKMINAYPLPTAPGRFNNYSSNRVQTQSWNQGDIRIDHQITPKDLFFARYAIQNTQTTSPNTYPATTIAGLDKPVNLSDEASFAGTSYQPAKHFVASYTRIISPTVVNDFRVGFNRYKMDYAPSDYAPGAQLGNKLGVPNSNVTPREQNLPIFSPSGYLGIGQTRSLPIYRRENTFEELDNLTWTRGTHTLKMGIDFRRRQLTIYQTNLGNGRFNFSPGLTDSRNPAGTGGDSIASFMLGYATLAGHDYNFVFPGIRLNELGTYIADDWRITKKLTVNYGIRWDYFSPPSESQNRWSNFNVTTGKMDISGRNGVGLTADVKRYWKNLGPRFGFAYQALPHTVIRGGFGIFYNTSGSEAGTMRMARNIPFGLSLQTTPGDITPGPTVSQGFAPLPSVNFTLADNPSGVVTSVDPNFRPSYAEQFNLVMEHEIAPWEMVVKVAGVGNLGRRLYNPYNANQPIPGPTAVNTRRPLYALNPNISDVNYFTSNGVSQYYGLQVTGDKRFNHGVSVLLGYTWSHALDNVPLEFGGGATGPAPQDPRNMAAEFSNSPIDMRHRLTVSYLWALPFGKGKAFLNHGGLTNWVLGGWQTNGILTTQSGLWFSPVLQTSTTNGTGSRPNRSGSVNYPKTLAQWFDPSPLVFSSPKPYTYGNAGRNSLVGPGRTNWDASIFKSFPVYDRSFVEFRMEAFNTLNHPQFGYPNPNIGNAQAGQITSIVGNPRNLQASVRFQF